MLLLFPGLTWAASSASSCAIVPNSVQSVQAGSDADIRPQTGWTPVSLPDIWTARWPDYSGVVWYRLELNQDCWQATDVALFVERLNMAGSVWINDTLLWRDAQLTEPLSRSWNIQRHWQISPNLLGASTNTIWVQVAGVAFHSPGLGRLKLGPSAVVEAAYTRAIWMNKYALAINLVISGVVGSICLLIWAMRRREKTFGWYGLLSMLWVLFGYNTLATSAWPFTTSLQASVANSVVFVLYTTCFCLFTWRFGRCHLPKTEKLLLTVTAICVGLLVVATPVWQTHLLALCGGLYSLAFFANCIFYQYHAWKVRRTEDTLLAISLLMYLIIGIHATLNLMGIVKHEVVYVALSGLVGMVFMFLMLAWVFVRNIKKIEQAAEELTITVDETRVQLTSTLQREHALEVQNVRLKERLDIARDLHDGFGSSLVRSITLVEQTQEHLERKHYLSILKSMRDDLRQVIDNSASSSQLVQGDPMQWLAPIKHRFTRIFEELSMASSWSVNGQWPQSWTQSKQMDLTRFVEEGLTNVIKHSHATDVQVAIHRQLNGAAEMFVATIKDNGIGFDAHPSQVGCIGIGMQSMVARVQRLGGQLEVQSSPEGTTLTACFKLADKPT